MTIDILLLSALDELFMTKIVMTVKTSVKPATRNRHWQ